MQAMKDAVVNSRGSFFVWLDDHRSVWIDLWFAHSQIVMTKEFKDVSKVQGPDS